MIANGIAVEHLKGAERYVDQVIRAASRGSPNGIKYLGMQRCTPREEFAVSTRKRGVKRTCDTARSDLYLVKLFFEYKGKPLESRYLYLPFVGDAGTITIGGSRFTITPILSDRVISVGVENIFIRLLRDRLTLERTQHHFMIDDRREAVLVAWSSIYHKNAKQKSLRRTTKAECSLMHYLFCKYGFTDTFLKFGKCKPIVGLAEINKTVYPEDEWVICQSAPGKPRNIIKGTYWEASQIRVAVRKSELTPMVRSMLGGFFYVVDHFPTRVQPQWVEQRRLWMVLMGHVIFSGNVNEGQLYSDVEDHMGSLDEYLDDIIIQKLAEIGTHVNDIYELFAVTIERFNELVRTAQDKVASMYDKELSILYYVLFEISSAAFKLFFKLKAASKKGRNGSGRELTDKEINNTINLTLRMGSVYGMIKGHGEVTTISVPGDNKATKITSMLVPQSGSNRISNRKDRSMPTDPSRRLHVSVAEIGGYSNLPKSEPSGRARLNPHVKVDSKGLVLRDPAWVPLLDEIQEMFKH